ncbi:ATP-binding protein [Paenibacillus filicis]|uniref:histidine kinase n=1 Tax=Paenibacillus gyeongsangnamensis TaxID=3388067 RepID=A0ABT4QBG6_9BACL|nr:ATP-binding protein [Paenibacillus filicis]MCZ8514232.1 ATP-binding protein [Paenibacillus filicis]
MLSIFKDFLLNIFFIFSPLVLYQFIYKTKSNVTLYRFLLYILFSFALIVTMSLPFNLDGLIYDFRSIPFVVGSLYGGTLVSILLYAALVLYRYTMGSPYPVIYAVSFLPSLALILLSLKRYQDLTTAKKIALTIALCTAVKLLTFFIYLSWIGDLGRLLNKPIETIETYVLQSIIAAFCIYIIESLNTYFSLQDEIIKSEKIRIVSDLAASVAHEIRNPLTSVRGFIQLLGDGGLTEERRVFYQQISLAELDRAQLIISEYLSLAKPDLEKIESIDMNVETDYVSKVLQTYANFNNIELEVALDQNPIVIIGDKSKLHQALVNLGKNAVEAMPDGGKLQFKVSRDQDLCLLNITDTGTGMTKEQLNRLGTPYYSTKEKGTGLGTMVSFGIIKKMNGTIDIKSEPGTGTEYTISFPMSGQFTNEA